METINTRLKEDTYKRNDLYVKLLKLCYQRDAIPIRQQCGRGSNTDMMNIPMTRRFLYNYNALKLMFIQTIASFQKEWGKIVPP